MTLKHVQWIEVFLLTVGKGRGWLLETKDKQLLRTRKWLNWQITIRQGVRDFNSEMHDKITGFTYQQSAFCITSYSSLGTQGLAMRKPAHIRIPLLTYTERLENASTDKDEKQRETEWCDPELRCMDVAANNCRYRIKSTHPVRQTPLVDWPAATTNIARLRARVVRLPVELLFLSSND